MIARHTRDRCLTDKNKGGGGGNVAWELRSAPHTSITLSSTASTHLTFLTSDLEHSPIYDFGPIDIFLHYSK